MRIALWLGRSLAVSLAFFATCRPVGADIKALAMEACAHFGARSQIVRHIIHGEVIGYRVVPIPADRLTGIADGDPEGADFGLMLFRSDGEVRPEREHLQGEFLILVPPDAGQMFSRAQRFAPGERLILGVWDHATPPLVIQLSGVEPDFELSNSFCGQFVLEDLPENIALLQLDDATAEPDSEEEECYVTTRSGVTQRTVRVECR